MNAIEITNLTKNFKNKQALCGLNMTVSEGAIYGFIGENGSGKSTTEKLICVLLVPSGGQIKLFGKDYTDSEVRAGIGCLIEAPGCFANYSVWNNMILQAANLGIDNAEEEVRKALKLVRMEGAASNKYKNCSLGMKQRVGIVRGGKMIKEMTAKELDEGCRTYVALKTKDMERTKNLLGCKYSRVKEENGYLRVYDGVSPEDIVTYLYENTILVSEIKTDKISLEEYYIDLMNEREVR